MALAEAKICVAKAAKGLLGADPGEQREAARAAGSKRATTSFEVVAREWCVSSRHRRWSCQCALSRAERQTA
jgi:hypothetical protein